MNNLKIKAFSLCITMIVSNSVFAEKYVMPIGKSHYENSISVSTYVPPVVVTTPEEPALPELSTDWLAFIQSHNSLLDITDLNDWITAVDGNGNVGYASMSGSGVTDSSIPQGSFGVENIHRLVLSSTSLTNLDFMQGVKTLQWNFIAVNGVLESISGLSDLVPIQAGNMFQFQNNSLTSLNGIGHIQQLELLNVSNNQLTNLNDISSLVTLEREMNIQGNSTLTDISGLANIRIPLGGDYGMSYFMQVDDPLQYTTKVPISSNFCIDLLKFDFSNYNYPIKRNGQNIHYSDICE